MKRFKNWNEISIEKYIQLYKIEEKEMDDIDLLINQLSIVYELSINEVENLEMAVVNDLKGEITFLNYEPNQTINLDKPIVIDGVEYQFNKNLNTLTLGEFADLEYYKNDVINNIHNITSILFKKEKDNDAIENSDIFLKKMDIETALSAFFFFYLFATNYIMSDTKGYSLLDKMNLGLMMNLKKYQEEKALMN